MVLLDLQMATGRIGGDVPTRQCMKLASDIDKPLYLKAFRARQA